MELKPESWTKDGYTITTHKSHLNMEIIHQFLSEQSYWAKGIARELVEKSIENSVLCYGVFKGNPLLDKDAVQIGFARVVSDLVRFSWLGDVFVLPEHRGNALGKWLVETIVGHPLLKGTSFNLGTEDAHTLYMKYGFKPLEHPQNRLARPLNLEVVYQSYGLQKN